MNELLLYYVYAGLVWAAGVILWCAYEDIFVGPGFKFGYNYKSPMAWIYVALVAIPIINLIPLFMIIRWNCTFIIKKWFKKSFG